MSTEHDFIDADEVTVGTVGEPGQRIFYLQARRGGRQVTVKMEKAQVAALCTALAALLADLPSPDPTTLPPGPSLALKEPIEPLFVVGTMGMRPPDAPDARAVLVCHELVRGATTDEEQMSGDQLLVGMTTPAMSAIVRLGEELMAGGRPPCPSCGLPLDADHSCPKTNGHVAR